MPLSESYLDTQSIFDLIGQHADLSLIFQTISEWLETKIPHAMVSIMSYSETEQTLSLVSGAKHFSPKYQDAVRSLKIGPEVGACGTAAFKKELIVCENLLTDPKWEVVRPLLLEENLHACWSTPIINAFGKLYGTFATYYRSPKYPTEIHIQLIRHAASLIALSMDLYTERQQKLALNDKYRSFFSYHPDAIFEHNLEGVIIDTNFASEDTTKFKFEQMVGGHYSKFICTDFFLVTQVAFEKALKGESQNLEIRAVTAAGEYYWLDITYLPIKQGSEIVGVFGIAHDITARRENEEMLRLLKRSVDANPHGIVLTDATSDQAIKYVNPAFENLTGYQKEEIMGKNCNFLQGPDTDPYTINKIHNALEAKQELQTIIKNYRKDGTWFWNQLVLGPVFDDQNLCTHFIGIQQDITQQRADSEYIAHQQTHDSLTGLINHHTFEKLVSNALLKKPQNPYSLVFMYIELDGFEPLNHRFGYLFSDQILVAVANRLRLFFEEDVIAHFLADQFGILMKDYESSEQIIHIAEKILKSLSVPFEIDDYKIHVSASIGIAHIEQHLEKSQFIYHAIHAMNEAKKQGGNTWHWYSLNTNYAPKIDYVVMRHELMVALKEKQFRLFYQPIIDANSGELRSVEALIRWQHPEKGFISPAEFIPFAEETGQIVEIGHWVLQQACEDIIAWNKKNDAYLGVAVNISALQFKRTGFLSDLQETLKLTQFPVELLRIEVTESMLIAGSDEALEILTAIRNLGIKVSLDDFGTGYSSLSYLRTLPADKIKIDRSFIENLPEDETDAAIISSIIIMAHKLGLEVVAEGIETLAQAELLKKYKCDYFQGYYFAKPAPITALKTVY